MKQVLLNFIQIISPVDTQKKNTHYCAYMHVLGTLFQDIRLFSCWRKSQARETIPLVAAAIPCIKLLMVSIYYRIAEWLRVDRISKESSSPMPLL